MNETRKAIIEYATQNENNLEISFETYKSYQDICQTVAKTFQIKLKERISKELSDPFWILPEIKADVYKEELTFLIKNKNWTEATQFGLKEFNDVDKACFAFQTNDLNKLNLVSIFRKNFPSSKANDHFWWLHLDGSLNGWRENFEGLKMVFNSEVFLDNVVNMIKEMGVLIDEYFKKEALTIGNIE